MFSTVSEKKNKPFVIVGTQRTGSSMIAGMLHNHPDINCGREWVLNVPPYRKISLAKSGLSRKFEKLTQKHASMMLQKRQANTIGFRLLFSSSPKWFISPQYSLANAWERLNGFIKFFNRNPNIKVIHIVRHDHLAWLASLFMAKSSNFYVNKKYPDNLKVEIPVKESIKRVRAKLDLEKKLRILNTSNPYFEIGYEEILTEQETIFKKLFYFLETPVPQVIPCPPMKKQQYKPLPEIITNFNDISQAILNLKNNKLIK